MAQNVTRNFLLNSGFALNIFKSNAGILGKCQAEIYRPNASKCSQRCITQSSTSKQINNKIQSDKNETKPESFATLLRNSTFIDLANFEGRIVKGVITQEIDDLVYVDFGGKFEAVCRIPLEDSHNYHRGANVTIVLKNFELSERFLGASKDITLLEAEAVLHRSENQSKILNTERSQLSPEGYLQHLNESSQN